MHQRVSVVVDFAVYLLVLSVGVLGVGVRLLVTKYVRSHFSLSVSLQFQHVNVTPPVQGRTLPLSREIHINILLTQKKLNDISEPSFDTLY